jgi:hypothetical protein
MICSAPVLDSIKQHFHTLPEQQQQQYNVSPCGETYTHYGDHVIDYHYTIYGIY